MPAAAGWGGLLGGAAVWSSAFGVFAFRFGRYTFVLGLAVLTGVVVLGGPRGRGAPAVGSYGLIDVLRIIRAGICVNLGDCVCVGWDCMLVRSLRAIFNARQCCLLAKRAPVGMLL